MNSIVLDPREINLEKTVAFLDSLTQSQETLKINEDMAEELNNLNDKQRLIESLMEPLERMTQILVSAHIDISMKRERIKNLIENQPKGEQIL